MTDQISQFLKIDKRRFKIKALASLNSSKFNRILQQATQPSDLTLAIFIDPEDSDNQASYIYNQCSQSDQQQLNEKQNSQKDSFYSTILTNLQTTNTTVLSVTVVQAVNANSASLFPLGYTQQDLSCVSICIKNQFYLITTQQYINCGISCKTCNGSTRYDCNLQQPQQVLDCSDTYIILQDNSKNKYCGKCLTNQYQFKNGNFYECQNCDPACNTCKGSGQYNCNTLTLLFEQKLDCSTNYIELLDNNNQFYCQVYQKDQFIQQSSNGNTGVKCNDSCNSCNGSTEYACTVLQSQIQLDCKNNYYTLSDNSNTKTCKNYNDSCNSCNGPSEYNCTLLATQNQLDCKTNYYTLKDSNDKLYCKANYYTLKDINKKMYCGICQANQFVIQDSNSNTCVKCCDSCNICIGPTEYNCTELQLQSQLDCCNGSCNSCNGPTEYNCTILKPISQLDCKENQYTLKDKNQNLFCDSTNEQYCGPYTNCNKACKTSICPTEYNCTVISQQQTLDYFIHRQSIKSNAQTVIRREVLVMAQLNMIALPYNYHHLHLNYPQNQIVAVITLLNNQLYCGICLSNQLYVNNSTIQACILCKDACNTCYGPTQQDCITLNPSLFPKECQTCSSVKDCLSCKDGRNNPKDLCIRQRDPEKPEQQGFLSENNKQDNSILTNIIIIKVVSLVLVLLVVFVIIYQCCLRKNNKILNQEDKVINPQQPENGEECSNEKKEFSFFKKQISIKELLPLQISRNEIENQQKDDFNNQSIDKQPSLLKQSQKIKELDVQQIFIIGKENLKKSIKGNDKMLQESFSNNQNGYKDKITNA
ncbi:hypothetical protein ABPG72_000362 [Tetrahymena utriculariae]